MIKKVLIADRLAFFVDRVFEAPGLYESKTIWLAVIAYSIQIYCDFSGYSDMAIGLAKCMGFELPINFRMPYISKNITEFWRRWHITLSTWLRDYLYIPLGGNRKGSKRTYINLMLTMLLGGLWHGASWNFVIWGGIHGAGLAVHKYYMKIKGEEKEKKNILKTAITWLATYLFVITCWVFFRSQSFVISTIILKKMYLSFTPAIEWLYTPALIIIPIVIASHIFGIINKERYPILNLQKPVNHYILYVVIFGLFFLAPVNPTPFIYFQF
ncbi:MAG: MBOAT family O-acyltransferase [Thermotogota bacterium]|nr:MBOAT family O-acyltransferase [Thermotogota bacterium]